MELVVAKKTHIDKTLSERSVKLANKLALIGEPLTDNPHWQKRLREIMDFLPEDTVAGLVARMENVAGEKSAQLKNFAELYGLTPAEIKLLASLSDGLSVPEHAAKMGISVNTGRVHMQRILDKTSTSGQLDLMKSFHTG